MAAIDFPASPSNGQIFNAPNGASYQWNGTLWLALAGSPPGNPPTGAAGGALTGTYPNPTLARLTWQLYAETILVAPAAEIRVNVPAACKMFELEGEIWTAASNQDSPVLQALQGATVVNSANHNTEWVLGAGTSAQAAANVNLAYWLLTTAGVGGIFRVRGSLAPGVVTSCYMEGNFSYQQTSQFLAQTITFAGGPPRNTVTGFRVAYTSAANLLTGSYVRAMVLM